MQTYPTKVMTTGVVEGIAVQTAMSTDIVYLESSDFAIASDHLSAAFSQDPLISQFLPQDIAAKQRALKCLSRACLNFAKPYGHIYTTADAPKGVAIWLPPEAFKFTLSQLWQALTSGFMSVPFYLRWNRIIDFASLIKMDVQMHEKFASEPHWYLGMLGVSPDCQGQGIGGKLLRPVLEKADQAKLPCYLTTTTASAVRFYQRHGFEILQQETFFGRDYWAMKRYPQG